MSWKYFIDNHGCKLSDLEQLVFKETVPVYEYNYDGERSVRFFKLKVPAANFLVFGGLDISYIVIIGTYEKPQQRISLVTFLLRTYLNNEYH